MINFNEDKSLFYIKEDNFLLLIIRKNNNLNYLNKIYIENIILNIDDNINNIINNELLFNKLKLLFNNNDIIIKKYIKIY